MFKEFKKFISRGNVVDLAVGIIIGGAFAKIITSLVNDLIMPLVGLIMGGKNLADRFYAVGDGNYATLAQAEEAGVAVFRYGAFLQSMVDFLVIAFCLFLIVRAINKARIKREEAAVATEKTCAFCKMSIPIEAKRCPYCTVEIHE
ncbi:MAG: large conductance mechanosensitive channel protein MscL [Tissierellia bacterium]|nr:large conductance mechanosensitive channel protein MscL [Tissierellia bacterium]